MGAVLSFGATLAILAGLSNAADLPTEGIDQQWLKTVVSIEMSQGTNQAQSIGTGFVYGTTNFRCILITAAHVIREAVKTPNLELAYRINNKDGSSVLLTEGYMKTNAPGEWFYSEDGDVACRYVHISNERDVVMIPRNVLLPQNYIRAGAPLCIAGYPLGLRSEKYATPVLRRGIVSRSEKGNLLVDASLFPGNSGGPVIYIPTVKFDPNVFSISTLTQDRVVGIVSSVVQYVDVAVSQQTKRPRVTFEEYSGLCDVVPADVILALIDRPDVKKHDVPFR